MYDEYIQNLDEIAEHTEKKFKIISNYIREWSYKLLGISDKIVYIDCMSNAGIYKKKNSNIVVEGTAKLVADVLSQTIKKYSNKKIELYFNDKEDKKIDILKNILPRSNENFVIHYSVKD